MCCPPSVLPAVPAPLPTWPRKKTHRAWLFPHPPFIGLSPQAGSRPPLFSDTAHTDLGRCHHSVKTQSPPTSWSPRLNHQPEGCGRRRKQTRKARLFSEGGWSEGKAWAQQSSEGTVHAQERHSGREEIDLLVSIWQLWGGAWCQARCWWFGRCSCSGGRAPLPAQWGTSQSSRTHLSGAQGSRWWTWDRSWGKTGRHKGRGACPSGRRRQDARSDHSHHTSGQGWRWAGIHPQGGHTWGCSRSLHSDSSPGGGKRQSLEKARGRWRIYKAFHSSVLPRVILSRCLPTSYSISYFVLPYSWLRVSPLRAIYHPDGLLGRFWKFSKILVWLFLFWRFSAFELLLLPPIYPEQFLGYVWIFKEPSAQGSRKKGKGGSGHTA